MKKTLFVLSVFAAFALASCSSKSDCDCTVSGNNVPPTELFTDEYPTFTEIEKNCDEINWNDFTNHGNYGSWADGADYGYTLSCVEH